MESDPKNWLLVPSPLLGPVTWQRAADVLVEMGQSVVIADPEMTTRNDLDHVTPWLEQILEIKVPEPSLSTVVVAHSAACPRAPMLVQSLIGKGVDVQSMILVDGRFPDGRSFTLSEPRYSAMLDGLVRPDDYLPPWPRWWGSLVTGLVVDPTVRDTVVTEASPAPRTWFDQSCPVPELPSEIDTGFLSFGKGYEESRQTAKDAGWYTLALTGDHLHQMVAPDAVAATLRAMVDCMANSGWSR